MEALPSFDGESIGIRSDAAIFCDLLLLFDVVCNVIFTSLFYVLWVKATQSMSLHSHHRSLYLLCRALLVNSFCIYCLTFFQVKLFNLLRVKFTIFFLFEFVVCTIYRTLAQNTRLVVFYVITFFSLFLISSGFSSLWYAICSVWYHHAPRKKNEKLRHDTVPELG